MAVDLVDLMRGLDDRVPRYTSYPTADRFEANVGVREYLAAVRESNSLPLPPPLSLYVHVPFCHSLCYFCGCNKMVTRNLKKPGEYLEALGAELRWHGRLFDHDRKVDQLHLGGGTPTFLTDLQLQKLLRIAGEAFELDYGREREFSIEIDPRTVDAVRARNLVGMGFNRFSLGIQDFDPDVQASVNRVQSFGDIEAVVASLRASGDVAISFDLIYGLPHQNRESFGRTIERTIELLPDRIAVYRYAHLPQRFKSQRLLESDRPELEERLEMFAKARRMLLEAGYEAIGLDHFARPEDELARAWKDGSLHRNFQGYSTRGGRDLIAAGPSAMGFVGHCFVQNEPRYADWKDRALEGDSFVRGFVMNTDDRMRARLIQDIMCRGRVNLEKLAERYTSTEWKDLFDPENGDLHALESKGLIQLDGPSLVATPEGILALRQIAKTFDRYL
ncbi:MAG: oxygen-independent coproporphyrinogen III oxidase, partial [Pseudomonadota bacterium]